jgi:hypothetical protein
MLHLRRNHGPKTLLQDATRAGNRIAEDALGAAQTARSEIGGLGREVRGSAATGVGRARRKAARGLETAASKVDETSGRRGRRRKPLVLVALAGLAGWVAVKVLRADRPPADEVAADAEEKAAKAEASVADATGKASGKVAGAARKVADEADKVGAQANARSSGSNAAH